LLVVRLVLVPVTIWFVVLAILNGWFDEMELVANDSAGVPVAKLEMEVVPTPITMLPF
jgi:hypothetical protein